MSRQSDREGKEKRHRKIEVSRQSDREGKEKRHRKIDKKGRGRRTRRDRDKERGIWKDR